MAKVIETTIEALVPDDKNFNKGTEFGGQLIEKSLREFGAGRSILLDKNNRIIAGNKTTENCANVGMEKVIIIETDGNELVAVKRKDIDINTPKGREMALADNATSAANLAWDKPVMMEVAELMDIDTAAWGISLGEEQPDADDENGDGGESYTLVVECKTSGELEQLNYELQSRGYKCTIK